MKKIVVILIFLYLPIFALAGTVDLQFSAGSQTVARPNQAAKIIVKVSNPATETIYFIPESTSSTGQFTPFSTGRSGSYYISRGDSTKSFYYKDSTIGNFVIKVSADTSKESDFSPISQNITISENATSQSNGSSGQNDNDTTDSDDTVDNQSVHTGETDLSNYTKESFKIGAGRERLATVRTPILFSASQNKKGKNTNYFVWSFGDGTSATGIKVYHTYQFPGRYNVVLNGSVDDEEEAVARTVVIVTESNMKITAVDLNAGFVEITNNSDKEQNLNNWALRTSGKEYPFPIDTIISPKTAIKIPIKILGLTNLNIQEIILVYPDGGVASGASLQTGPNLSKVTDLKKQLAKVKQQMAEKTFEANVPEAKPQAPRGLASGAIAPKNVVVLAKEPSWFEKIKHAIFE